mgnify:CR=1 FL=1
MFEFFVVFWYNSNKSLEKIGENMDFDENRKEQRRNDDYQPDPTRKELIKAEQPKVDSVEILYDPKNPDPKGKNQAIMEQDDQASETSSETLKLRNYKRRQMNEFTDNYLFSQVIPSRAVTVINVVNTFLLTIVLIIAFMVALGLLVGLRIGIVPTDSMKDEISVGSMVVWRPVADIKDIRVGDVLSYSYGSADYIHKVKSVGGGVIVMVGANSEDPKYQTLQHIIDFSSVHGRMILSIPYLGYVILFVQKYFVVVLAVFICLLIGLLLSRAILEKKHNDQEFKEFLDKKTEYEREAARRDKEEKDKEEQIRFENLMHE